MGRRAGAVRESTPGACAVGTGRQRPGVRQGLDDDQSPSRFGLLLRIGRSGRYGARAAAVGDGDLDFQAAVLEVLRSTHRTKGGLPEANAFVASSDAIRRASLSRSPSVPWSATATASRATSAALRPYGRSVISVVVAPTSACAICRYGGRSHRCHAPAHCPGGLGRCSCGVSRPTSFSVGVEGGAFRRNSRTPEEAGLAGPHQSVNSVNFHERQVIRPPSASPWRGRGDRRTAGARGGRT